MSPLIESVLRPTVREEMPLRDSEADLREEVTQALEEFPGRIWGRVDVFERNGRITLRGRVRSFHAKQLAQAVAMAVDGVERLNNEIVVEPLR